VNPQTNGNISVPASAHAPRDLAPAERATLARVADTLIPARSGAVAASAEPGFWDGLTVALDARADAFADIVGALQALSPTAAGEMWSQLQALESERPLTFQALSTVVTWAWLQTPGTSDRIGYHGQQSEKAGLDEAADEILSGVLEPVIARDAAGSPRWIR
jgi:hypothetical protein